jgi:hypothetical protein
VQEIVGGNGFPLIRDKNPVDPL